MPEYGPAAKMCRNIHNCPSKKINELTGVSNSGMHDSNASQPGVLYDLLDIVLRVHDLHHKHPIGET